MFDLFRSRDKAVRYLLGAVLGIVALSMVVTLIPGYGGPSRSNEQTVAEVGGQPITFVEVQRTLQRQLKDKQLPQELVQMYVPQIIDQLVAMKAVAYQADRMGFKVSDEDLGRAVRSILPPQLIKPDGSVDKGIYAQMLAQQGLTIDQFEKGVKENLQMLWLQNVALEGAVVSPKEAEAEFHRANDKVKLDYVVVNAAEGRAPVNVTPAEVEDYFNKNRAQYKISEKRSFNLLLADEAKMGAAFQIPDSELQKQYAANQDRFRTPERVQVRHILIKTQDKPASEVPKLEAKANDLLKQVKGGADFAALAKANSEDPGSAVNGGDLGWVTRGQTVPEFEKSAFSLKPKEISGVVKTQYGFHILQGIAKEEAKLRPFEEVKGELATEGRKEAVYRQMQTAVEQAKSELAKPNADAAAIASKLNLTYVKAEKLAPADSVPEVGTNQELQTRLTGTKKGDVTDIIQFGPSKLGVVQITEVIPQRPAELAEVQDQVRNTLTQNKTQLLVEEKLKTATDKLKGFATSGDLSAAAKAVGGQVKSTQFFAQDGAADGIGQASYVKDAFDKPAGAFVGPFRIGNQVFLAKTAEKQVATSDQLAAKRDEIILTLKRKKAAERKDLFEDGVVTQLTKEGKIKKYNDTISRLVNSFRS